MARIDVRGTAARAVLGGAGALGVLVPGMVVGGEQPALANADVCDGLGGVGYAGIYTCLHIVEANHYFNEMTQSVHFNTRYDGCLSYEINYDYTDRPTETVRARDCFHDAGTFKHLWRKNWDAPHSLYRVCATMRRDDGGLQTDYACANIG